VEPDGREKSKGGRDGLPTREPRGRKQNPWEKQPELSQEKKPREKYRRKVQVWGKETKNLNNIFWGRIRAGSSDPEGGGGSGPPAMLLPKNI